MTYIRGDLGVHIPNGDDSVDSIYLCKLCTTPLAETQQEVSPAHALNQLDVHMQCMWLKNTAA